MYTRTSQLPQGLNGTHYLNGLCKDEETAYSEGFADFYSGLICNVEYRDYDSEGGWFGINMETVTSIGSNKPTPVSIPYYTNSGGTISNPFYEEANDPISESTIPISYNLNQRLEARIAGALYDLCDTGTNEPHDTFCVSDYNPDSYVYPFSYIDLVLTQPNQTFKDFL